MQNRAIIITTVLSILAITLSGCAGSGATGNLKFYANGEDFVRQGFVSKDGWAITFDHVYINLSDIAAYQTEPPYEMQQLFLFIDTDQGVSGIWGSISRGLAHQIEALKPALIGENPHAVERIWDKMYRHAIHGRKGETMMAISAIDLALWDLKGKLLGAPVYQLLGGPTRYRLSRSVAVTATREDLVRAVDTIRDVVGLAGKVTTELDGVSWETTGEVSQIHVSMFPRDDGTEVRVAVDRDGAAVLTVLGPVAGALVLGGITGSIIEPGTVIGGVALMGSWLAGGAGLARVLWGRSTAVIRERASRVLDAVTRTLGGPTGPDALPGRDPETDH